MRTLLLVAAGAVVATATWLVHRRLNQLPAALAERPDMPPAEIYRQFYADVGIPLHRFVAWWTEIAKAFSVPPARVRPSDRFGIELPLRSVLGMTDEDLFLFLVLKRHVGKDAAKAAFPTLQTVDQAIRFLGTEAK